MEKSLGKLGKMIIICGPTASGKTSLAVSVAKALGSEVISADSMNIYKGLDVGTAKPTAEEMQGVKHHLIDVVSPTENFSVGDYKEKAEPIAQKLISEGKIPVVCGGTGFYINSLLYDFSYGNGKGNPAVREKYQKLADEKGKQFVYGILCEKDKKTAEKLHYNDLKRVIRALEICEGGIKKSEIVDDLIPKYDYRAFMIDRNKEDLYRKINDRVDLMIKNGLVEEVKRLLSSGVTETCQCMQGIGYKEILPYLRGEATLVETMDRIKLNTRHYAKRQVTFFKKLPRLIYLKPDNENDLVKRILESL